ncbi:MAG: SdrD B-like domain-containing protein, partial [Bacilli bacterium]
SETKESVLKNPEKIGAINDFNPYYSFDAGTAASLKGTKVGASLLLGEIRGRVFEDVNVNGIYEALIDNLLADRSVNLYKKDAESNYVFVKQVKSDNTGTYTFDELDSGNYKVEFIKDDATEEFTLDNRSTNEVIDSDVHYNGDNKGLVLNVDPTLESSRYVNAGIVKYNINDVVLTAQHNDVVMLASNAQKTNNFNTSVTISPNFDLVADPNNGIVWSVNDTSIVTATSGAKESTLTAGATTLASRQAVVTVTINDIFGGSKAITFNVTVNPNNIPTIIANDVTIEAATVVNEAYLNSLATTSDNEDGDAAFKITNNVSSVTTDIKLNSSNKAMTLGKGTIVYTFKDSNDNTTSKTINYEVVDTTAPVLEATKTVTVEASNKSLPKTVTEWNDV